MLTGNTLPMRARFPFDTQSEAGYAIAYAIQVFGGFLALNHLVVMENIGWQSINQIALHIKLLMIKYDKLGTDRKEPNDQKFQKQIKATFLEFIKEHQDIIAYKIN